MQKGDRVKVIVGELFNGREAVVTEIDGDDVGLYFEDGKAGSWAKKPLWFKAEELQRIESELGEIDRPEGS